MPERNRKRNLNISSHTVETVAAATISIGGIALAFMSEKYGVSSSEATIDIGQIIGSSIAIPAAVVFINKVTE